MSRFLVVWLLGALVVAVAGVFAGRVLKGPGPGAFAFDTRAPAYSGADLPVGRSKGGFTGFSETGGLPGLTIVSGRVTAVASDSVTLSTPAGENTIRLTGDDKLRSLRPYAGAIAPGTTVVAVTKPGTAEAQALLLLLEP